MSFQSAGLRWSVHMKKLAPKFSLFTGIVIPLLVLFTKWLYYAGTSYTVLGYLRAVGKYKSVINFIAATNHITVEKISSDAGYFNVLPSYGCLFLVPLTALLLLLRSLLLLFHKKTDRLSLVIYCIGALYLSASLVFFSYAPSPTMLLSCALLLADFLIAGYFAQRDEILRKARELKRIEKAAKADKKRRMLFPGKYSREFFQVIWCNFKSHFKSYLLFILAGTTTAALLCCLLGTQFFLGSLHEKAGFVSKTGLTGIMGEFIPALLFVSVLLLVLIISNYIKTRMVNYGTFIGLGIRRKTLWLIIGMEYAVCILISAAAGLLIGCFILSFLKILFLQTAPGAMTAAMPYAITVLAAFLVYLLVVGLATLINYHLFEGVDISASLHKSVEKEPFPRHFRYPAAVLGCYLIISPIVFFWFGNAGEGASKVLKLLLGCLLILYFPLSMALTRYLKNPRRFLKKLLEVLPWKYRFRTTVKYFFILFALHVLAFSIFIPRLSTNLIVQPAKDLVPYDFVCMAHENDRSYFQELEKQYGAEMKEYKMVRLNTILGEPYSLKQVFTSDTSGMLWPPGQHVGISESTYIKLKTALGLNHTEPPKLRGREIHIVYQQDAAQKSHPLDWNPYSSLPHLKAGSYTAYNYGNIDQLFPAYHIKSQEAAILTGMFHGGAKEDIVVFGDKYFNSLYHSVTAQSAGPASPTRLITMEAPHGKYGAIQNALEKFAEKHAQDSNIDQSILPFYSKTATISAISGERFLETAAFSAVIILLLFTGLFIFYLKFTLEEADLRKQYEFLEYTGMRKKERIHLLLRQMSAFSLWPLVSGIAISAPFFTAIPVIRDFKGTQTLSFYFVFLLLLALYLLVHSFVMNFLERHFIKSIEL